MDGASFHQHFNELLFPGIYLPGLKEMLVICVICVICALCVSTALQSYGKCIQIRVMTYREAVGPTVTVVVHQLMIL